MGLIVLAVRQCGRVRILVSRMMGDIGAKFGQHSPVALFHMTISLRMTGFCEPVLHVENHVDVLKELGGEQTSIVGNKIDCGPWENGQWLMNGFSTLAAVTPRSAIVRNIFVKWYRKPRALSTISRSISVQTGYSGALVGKSVKAPTFCWSLRRFRALLEQLRTVA